MGKQPAAVLPSPVEKTLANGVRVIVAKSTDLPLVSATLLFTTGAEGDAPGRSGTADLTADLVAQGTTTRSARDIARQTETLGADLEAGAGWEVSTVTLSVMANKLSAALPIMADVARNPTFAPDELERTRKQDLEGLEVAYENPGQVAGFAAAPLVYGPPFNHAANGTPASLKRLTRDDVARFHHDNWRPEGAILVLTGDITPDRGFTLAQGAFGDWPRSPSPPPVVTPRPQEVPRAIAIDLPNTGQADVVVTKPAITRTDPRYYHGLVANAVLGGGYSARLNEEVRVRRGLSYGASSTLTARRHLGAFTAEAQTKNDAAPQVASLIKDEMASLAQTPPTADELTARKSALIGEYGRAVGTVAGLGNALATLALYGIDLDEIGAYTDKVEAVDGDQVQAFAKAVLDPGQASVLVVGDAKAFLPALKTALPNLVVIPIAEFDPDSPTLRSEAAK
ncbi:MAG: M16 family metallopeptidase [Caulobacterales bacterium]